SILPQQGDPMGIDSPLVDNEGYPRADIDVYRARTLRKRFHEIQNDHKALVHKIDIGLVEITATSTGIAREEQNHVSFQEPITPFAIIDEVFSNSPAHEAGLKEGDVLLRFGSVNSTNHRDFRAIAELVPVLAGEGKSVPITVRRKQNVEWGEVVEVKTLDLKPRPWEGRGLLGCHINKYTE
ncbi:predicted protein, partial [Thalassiosira pseudonana CCMP1335]